MAGTRGCKGAARLEVSRAHGRASAGVGVLCQAWLAPPVFSQAWSRWMTEPCIDANVQAGGRAADMPSIGAGSRSACTV